MYQRPEGRSAPVCGPARLVLVRDLPQLGPTPFLPTAAGGLAAAWAPPSCCASALPMAPCSTSPDAAPADLGPLLRPAPDDALTALAVGPFVNSARHEGMGSL